MVLLLAIIIVCFFTSNVQEHGDAEEVSDPVPLTEAKNLFTACSPLAHLEVALGIFLVNSWPCTASCMQTCAFW